MGTDKKKLVLEMQVVVAQLVKLSLAMKGSTVRNQYPVNFLLNMIYCKLYWKGEIEKKAGNGIKIRI